MIKIFWLRIPGRWNRQRWRRWNTRLFKRKCLHDWRLQLQGTKEGKEQREGIEMMGRGSVVCQSHMLTVKENGIHEHACCTLTLSFCCPDWEVPVMSFSAGFSKQKPSSSKNTLLSEFREATWQVAGFLHVTAPAAASTRHILVLLHRVCRCRCLSMCGKLGRIRKSN